MAKLITSAERIEKVKALIEQAKAIPVPPSSGWQDFTYVAKVKDTLRQAKEMIKLVPVTASASLELKKAAKQILDDLPGIENEILHRSG